MSYAKEELAKEMPQGRRAEKQGENSSSGKTDETAIGKPETTVSSISRTQRLAGIALFTALAIILNLSPIKFPAPYLTFLMYEIWEIPIIIALVMFGLRSAIMVAVLNTIILLVISGGPLAAGPLYNLAAVIFSLAGVAAGHRLARKLNGDSKFKYIVVLATSFAIFVRVVGMTLFNAYFLPFPPPIGFYLPQSVVYAMLPLIAFFNGTVSLYSVPLAYVALRAALQRHRFKVAYALGLEK